MNEKRVVITEATGMVGACALRICLENPDVSLLTHKLEAVSYSKKTSHFVRR